MACIRSQLGALRMSSVLDLKDMPYKAMLLPIKYACIYSKITCIGAWLRASTAFKPRDTID